MAKADEAYKATQRLIADAVSEGATGLYLHTPKTRALTALPPEIADLSGWLPTLDLNNTQITDAGLAQIKSLANLQGFDLDNTQIADLRPLLQFPAAQGDAPNLTRLFFSNTPATRLDPRLAELSEIDDAPERTRQTLAYLREGADD